jgi:hypothetical protein
VFERKGTNWTQTAKLHASDAEAYRYFGSSVALSGNQALVGSPGSGVVRIGAAYLFEYDGTAWTEQAILSTNTTTGTETLIQPIGTWTFGRSVSFQGGTALVGQPRAGVAFLFPLSPPPTVNLHRSDPTASEPGTDTAQFKVTRSGNTDDALRVFYEVTGTATPGIDYASLRGFATIAAGETSALFKVKPIDDNDPEEPETVYVSLLPDPAYDRVRPFRACITIADDD